MTAIGEKHFEGQRNVTPQASSGKPGEDLASILRAGLANVPAWTTGVAVAGDTATLSAAGWVLAVEATAGGSTGPKALVNSAPAAGQCQVVYTDGVATLNFAGADAVTAAAVQVLPAPHTAP